MSGLISSEITESTDEAACTGLLDESLRLIAADGRLLDWLEVDEAAGIGQPLTKLLPAFAAFQETVRLAQSQQQACTFHDVALPGAPNQQIELTIAPFMAAGGLLSITAVVLPLLSTTAQPQSLPLMQQNSWRHQAKQLALLVESVRDAIISTNEALQIQSWNRAAEHIYGWQSQEVIGKLLTEVLPTTFPEQEQESVLDSLAKTGSWNGVMIQVRKDGQSRFIQSSSKVLLDLQNKPVGLVAVNRDITERQLVDEAIREAEKRYRALFDEAPVMYATTLADGALISDCNHLFWQTLGYERQELIGQPLFNFYTPESKRLAEVAGYQQALLGRFTTQERQFVTQSGRIVTTLLSASPMRDNKSGQVIGTRTMYIDISGLKAAEAERERLFIELEEANKRLRLLSRNQVETQEMERRRIARELHDEIGQTLTAVKLQLQSMQRLFNDTAAQEGLKGSIIVVDQALLQVRDISLNLRPSLLDDFGLVTTLRWYLDRQSQWAEFEAQFHTNLDDRRLPSELESVCFRIVQEALTNIIRHARAKHVFITLNQHGLQLRLTIQDDGVGFDVKQAFSHATKGNSLGLLGMEERVMLVNGTLKISSSATKGSLLELLIPL